MVRPQSTDAAQNEHRNGVDNGQLMAWILVAVGSGSKDTCHVSMLPYFGNMAANFTCRFSLFRTAYWYRWHASTNAR